MNMKWLALNIQFIIISLSAKFKSMDQCHMTELGSPYVVCCTSDYILITVNQKTKPKCVLIKIDLIYSVSVENMC